MQNKTLKKKGRRLELIALIRGFNFKIVIIF